MHGTSYYSGDRTAAEVRYGYRPGLPQLYGGVRTYQPYEDEIRSVEGPGAGRGRPRRRGTQASHSFALLKQLR